MVIKNVFFSSSTHFLHARSEDICSDQIWCSVLTHILQGDKSETLWFPFSQVSLMNLLFLVLWVFALPFPRLRPLASSISAVWACVMVVCKMFYQLKVIKPLDYSSNCTAVSVHNCLCLRHLSWIPLVGFNLIVPWSMYLHKQSNQ